MTDAERAAFAAGEARGIERAAARAMDFCPTATPPRVDPYGHHVAGERYASERIAKAIRALTPTDQPALDAVVEAAVAREREATDATIFVLREALTIIVRERQSNAQAGFGEYQRGYDDCIAAHEELAKEALLAAAIRARGSAGGGA